MPRGRIELPTPAFSGPRSTDELPRHGDNQRFYGKAVEVKRENAGTKSIRRLGLVRSNPLNSKSKASGHPDLKVDREGLELRFSCGVEAFWPADEGVAEFVEAQDAIGVFCDADPDAFADWAGLADG